MSLTAGARDLILEKTTNLIICTTDGKTTPDDDDLANLIKFNCTYHDSITISTYRVTVVSNTE